MIPEAHDRDPLLGQKFLSCVITFFAQGIVMAGTIQLDCQFCSGTIEIQNVRIDGMLSPEFVAGKVSISKVPPENTFTVGCVLAEIVGARH